MSQLYSRVATVTIDGHEQDLPVRGWIYIEEGAAYLDGDVQVRLDGGWFDANELALAAGDRDRIEEGLSETAFIAERDAHDEGEP